jgi:cellulose synthase/poly-beta-1,6-N-acetylglucosamine synthase-like glycosyltransferase
MHWLLLILLAPYVLMLLKIYIGLTKLKPFIPRGEANLFVSVVVACRNEESNILSLLNCIAAQDQEPGLFEVIIVDDNSVDKTYNIATSFDKIPNKRVIRNDGMGKKQALRRGIEAAAGQLVIVTDSDCRAGKSWIRTLTSFFLENNKPDMIICPVLSEGEKGFFRLPAELEFLGLQGITAGTAASGAPVMCNGANLTFTRDTYMKHCRYLHDEIASGDDIFLLHAAKRDGTSRISWLEAREAVVTTKLPCTLLSFLSQRARWLSKAGSYNDTQTIMLGLATFTAVLLQASIMMIGMVNTIFLPLYCAIVLVKSIPDFLILKSRAEVHGMQGHLKAFVPAQVVYPLYVLGALLFSLLPPGKWK